MENFQSTFPINILIVDDEPKNLFSLTKWLEQPTHHVFHARSGNEALGMLLEREFALVILDICMPGIDGFEVASLMKVSVPTKKVPIIFMSGQMIDPRSIQMGYEKGAHDYLIKPVEPYVLLAKVSALVELYLQRKRMEKTVAFHRDLQKQLKQWEGDLKKKQQIWEDEMQQAQDIQAALLPAPFPKDRHIRVASRYEPFMELGGDLYDVFELHDGRVGLFVADVTGHGLSAALLSMMVSSYFKMDAIQSFSAQHVLRELNQQLYQAQVSGKFVTAFYGIYDRTTRALQYSIAGHPPAYVLRHATGELHMLPTTDHILGVFPKSRRDFHQETFQLEAGDKLFLYTDALIDSVNSQMRPMGCHGLEKLLKQNLSKTLNDLLDFVYEAASHYSFCGELNDDLTMVGMEVL